MSVAELRELPIVAQDSDMARKYLSKTEAAIRIGVKPQSLNAKEMPAPDVKIGEISGWSEKTIDDWHSARPGKGNWGPKVPAKKSKK